MATTKKTSGRAASVALARQRLRAGNQTHAARASATIPAAVLSVVQPDAKIDPSLPTLAPIPSNFSKILESQREGLRRLDALERLVMRTLAEVEALRRDLGSDPTTPDPDPDDPTTPEPVPQPEPGDPQPPDDPPADPETDPDASEPA